MKKKPQHYSIPVLLLLLATFLIDLAKPQLPSQDILTLLQFKKTIKHDPTSFILSSWNEESIDFNGCPSSWNGIVCDAAGNVAALLLDNLSISATTDFSIFANLTHLVNLSLPKNLISGTFPHNVGHLFRNLQFLDLSDNLFFGELPREMGYGNFPSLKNLSLGGNNFSGALPDFTSLETIDLSRNALSGALPLTLSRIDKLVYLNLSCNAFTRTIPSGFEEISTLEAIDLHNNQLEGNLDVEFLLLTSAVYVDFSRNLLSTSGSGKGKFLPSISEAIKYLNLSGNRFTGSLINGGELPIFGRLKVLDLSYNQLSGELPEFNFVYELEVLRLGNNQFFGFVPNGLLKGDSLVLAELDLSSNNLSGPVSMITSTSLRALNLSSNKISGELPLLIQNCVVLDLSKNNFIGSLSRMVKWGNSIEFLDLSQNQLVGSIPELSSQFLRLNYLNLSYNLLSDSLPKVLIQYPKLKVLDLSFNQLSGPLLTDLLTLPTLQELHLENNSLTGAIKFSPPSPNEPNLVVLDLSDNQFNGDFPAEFGSLTGLHVLDIAGNNLSGSLPSSIGQIISLTSLDISQNQFTGSLLESLPNSLQNFNASYNNFSGPVPENLRKFPELSFHPGNPSLQLPSTPFGGESPSAEYTSRKPIKTVIKVVVIVTCILAVIILILLAIFIHYIRISRRSHQDTRKNVHSSVSSNPGALSGRESGGSVVISAEDLMASRKGSSSEIISPEEKAAAVIGFSPSKTSHISSSPESGDSFTPENLGRLDVGSPDRLAGELHFLDDSISLTPEELSRAPAEVLGRSSHGTSYRATLDSGVFLTVKWLREGVAKQKKEFSKEAKKFANIRHPNVVGLRGYYWGPTQHEKLILSDYISPGSLASFLYDRPRRKGPLLTWIQRLKIAVDVARGLNYLHFDREVPHGNLKSTNILLDGPELNARIADYCLHRLMTQMGTVEQILDAGVLGYRAPELAAAKKPSPSFKSDVYAFGIILLELLTGKCAGDVISGEEGGLDLTDWVRVKVAEGLGSHCFDAALSSEMEILPAVEKGIKEVLGIGLRCIRPLSERPGIKSVYEDLSSI